VAEATPGSSSGRILASSVRAGPTNASKLLRLGLADERPERVGERTERQAFAAELDAAAGQHSRARLARAPGRLRGEPSLADSGLATDEHDARFAADGGVDGGGQHAELGPAADEDRTHQIAPHRAPCSQQPDETWRGSCPFSSRHRRGHARQLAAAHRRPARACARTAAGDRVSLGSRARRA
jgi:hypothetical protein